MFDIGGYAFNHYTEPRATEDLDVFVNTSDENVMRVFKAFAPYGAPIASYIPADFQNARFGFQFGNPPSRIDVLLAIDAVGFQEDWDRSVAGTMDYGRRDPGALPQRGGSHSEQTRGGSSPRFWLM